MILLVGCTCAKAQDTYGLFIEQNGSDAVQVALTSLQRITFNNGAMQVVQKDGTSTSYTINGISRLYFDVLNGIQDKIADSQSLVQYISSDQIRVNSEAGSQVSLFRVDGSQVLQRRLSEDNGTVSISALPKGIYLLRVNGQAVKISKK